MHVLDWFHIAMKIQPLAQLAASAPDELASFGSRVERIKWRLWNGQAGRALALIKVVRRELRNQEVASIWEERANKTLETLQVYIRMPHDPDKLNGLDSLRQAESNSPACFD